MNFEYANSRKYHQCFNCKVELSGKTDSREHILPHSIGWKSFAKGILCKECNEKFGQTIDTGVFKNFQFPATVLNVYREKNRELPGMRLGSKNQTGYLWLLPGGTIKRSSPIQIVSESIWKVYLKRKKELDKIVKSFKKNFTTIKVEEIEVDSDILNQDDYFITEVCWNTGNQNVLRSLIKSAWIFYLNKVGIPEVEGAILNLREGKAYPIAFKRLSPEPISTEKVFHTIVLIGSKKHELLVSVIELFSTYRYFIILNNNYSGLDFCISESQNCISGEEQPLTQKFCIEDFEEDLTIDQEERSKRIINEIHPLKKLLNSIILNKLLNKKLDFDLFGISKGTVIDQEVIDRINESQKFTRYQTQTFKSLENLERINI